MVRKRKTSIGQAEIIGAIIALGLLITVVSALLVSLFRTSTTSTVGFAQRAQFESYKSSEKLGVIYEGDKCYLVNIGSVEVEIVRAWVLENGQFKNVSIDLTLKPNERTSDIPNDVIYVVTSRGNVFPFSEECKKQTQKEVAKALEVPFITFPFSSLTDLLTNDAIRVMDFRLIQPPRNPESITNSSVKGLIRIGRNGQKYAYVINETFKNVYIDFEGLLAGTAIIGFSPEWINAGTPRDAVNYSILLDIVKLTSGNIGSYRYTATATAGSQDIRSLLNSGGAGGSVRVKILNFRPDNISITYDFNVLGKNKARGRGHQLPGTYYVKLDNEDSIGIYPYSGTKIDGSKDVGPAGIKFKGYASEVVIYTLISVSGDQSTSYEPYMIITDTNGNLLPELIFDTIDISFLPKADTGKLPDTRDDNGKVTDIRGSTVALDYSLYPLLMELVQMSVSGRIYSGLEVLARVFFMDNIAFESATGVITDYGRALLGFGLMDSQGRLIASLNYTYQDLALAQSSNTYIGFWTTLRNPLIIPYSDEIFKIVVILQDPYKYDQDGNTYTNHADFIIGIELIGVTLYARGG